MSPLLAFALGFICGALAILGIIALIYIYLGQQYGG